MMCFILPFLLVYGNLLVFDKFFPLAILIILPAQFALKIFCKTMSLRTSFCKIALSSELIVKFDRMELHYNHLSMFSRRIKSWILRTRISFVNFSKCSYQLRCRLNEVAREPAQQSCKGRVIVYKWGGTEERRVWTPPFFLPMSIQYSEIKYPIILRV